MHRHSFSDPYLKCVSKGEASHIWKEIHERSYGNHFDGCGLTFKAMA